MRLLLAACVLLPTGVPSAVLAQAEGATLTPASPAPGDPSDVVSHSVATRPDSGREPDIRCAVPGPMDGTHDRALAPAAPLSGGLDGGGTGRNSFLVSRSAYHGLARHLFVIVTRPDSGEVITRFSYGPFGGSPIFGARLMPLTDVSSETNVFDVKALSALTAGPDKTVSVVRIAAPDWAVMAAGTQVNEVARSTDRKGGLRYAFYGANSNAAAYAVADLAVTMSGGSGGSQELPRGPLIGLQAYKQVERAVAKAAGQQGPSIQARCAPEGLPPAGPVVSLSQSPAPAMPLPGSGQATQPPSR